MIDISKQYRTRDGREVRIYATDACPDNFLGHSVHGAVKQDGTWRLASWRRDGRSLPDCESHFDLIEVRPRIKTKAWLNVYRREDGFEFAKVWETKHAADSTRGDACIACVEIDIDVEEGHGL